MRVSFIIKGLILLMVLNNLQGINGLNNPDLSYSKGQFSPLQSEIFYNLAVQSTNSANKLITGSKQIECRKPFGLSFLNRTTTSIELRWSDTNLNAESWDLELVMRGKASTGIPTVSNIPTKLYLYNNLNPSQAYDIYIRAKCQGDGYSDWNGPFLFTTAFTNPTECSINVPVKDNGTETFFIDVTESGMLGKDIFISSVDLIMEHDWPADMQFMLETPSGKSIILINHQGTVKDNFGNVNDSLCHEFTRIDQNACMSIESFQPPFIGSFKSFEEFRLLEDNSDVKGQWKLKTFDRATQDVGVIRFFRINFSNESCLIPDNFIISDIGNNEVRVEWSSFSQCNAVRFSIGFPEAPVDSLTHYFVNCSTESFVISGLPPNSNFQIFINAICGTSLSQSGCPIYFRTNCEAETLIETFDNQQKCIEGCTFDCLIEGVWQNTLNDGGQDWIVWSGKTDTELTGPDGDINNAGNYIYIENSPEICGTKNTVILESKCIIIKSNPSGCDFSFNYHMNGQNISFLNLEITIDDGLTWDTLFTTNGNNGPKWHEHTLSLAEYNNHLARIRFVSESGVGVFADIALDQINFYGSSIADGTIRYFIDTDGDGFGSITEYGDFCTSLTPPGYSSVSGDCDDSNAGINPNASEIQCNLIDENCNGMADDAIETNPIVYQATLKEESCSGFNDGMISLEISGGTPPYQIQWSNSQTGQSIENLGTGIYFAEISDTGGCQVRTEFFEITTVSRINFTLLALNRPRCEGISDGSISIEHSGGKEPFHYLWSNGQNTKNLDNLSGGNYEVTITDDEGCNYKSNVINLAALPSLTANFNSRKSPRCFGLSDGELSISVSNGTPPYLYSWNSGQNTAQISGIPAGLYISTISDQTGCSVTLTTELTQPSKIETEIVSIEDIRCFNENNGSIKTNTTGGTPPYTYFWNNFLFTDDIFNLPSGQYSLQVNDKNGCEVILSGITVDQPPLLSGMVDSIKSAVCQGGNQGYIKVSAKGGIPDYSFAWKHTLENLNFSDQLKPGIYSVTIFDQNGCKANIRNIEVPFLNEPIISELELINGNKCHNDTLAGISAEIFNGTLPLDFNWSSGVQHIRNITKDSITNLPSGTYSLTITDATGCTGISEQVVISSIPTLIYQVLFTQDNECNDEEQGLIQLSVSGGTPPLMVNWDNGQNGTTLSGLQNGEYAFTLTDVNECKLQGQTIKIKSDSDIKVVESIQHPTGVNADGKICLDVIGFVAPLTIIWDHDSAENDKLCVENLLPGAYTATLSDGGGCNVLLTIVLETVNSTGDVENRKYSERVYPNPADQYITIDSELKLTQIKIFNVNGKTLYILKAPDDKNYLDISWLSSGIYIVEISNNHYTKQLKLIKK